MSCPLQSATRELIDTSFRKLRSAEGACELLQNFKRIKSKGAIQKQVINKFNDILEQVRCCFPGNRGGK